MATDVKVDGAAGAAGAGGSAGAGDTGAGAAGAGDAGDTGAGAGAAGAGDAGKPAASAGDAGAPGSAPGSDAGNAGDAGKPGTGTAGDGKDGKPAADGKAADDKAADAGLSADNWRQTLAGEDKAKLNVLNRYTSFKQFSDAFFNLQEKVRTGEFKKPPGKDATDEQKANYRKEMGVPDKAEDYLKAVPDGIVLGDVDKGVMDGFLKDMHDKNATPDVVGSALASYVKAQEVFTKKLQEQDLAERNAAEATLRKEWPGVDYNINITAMKSLLESQFPGDVQEALINGRLGDEKSTPLLCHPGIIKSLAQIGRMLNPTGTVTGAAGIDDIASINDQIAAYEKRMGTDRNAWFKDEKAGAHLRELYTARERINATKR